MPFDPFFSSANKLHYIPNPKFTELKQKVMAMSNDDRWKWVESVWRDQPLSPELHLKRNVARTISFENHIRSRCKRRTEAESMMMDMNEIAQKHGAVVLHGHSGIGRIRSETRAHPFKSGHQTAGAKRFFQHVYRPSKRPKPE